MCDAEEYHWQNSPALGFCRTAEPRRSNAYPGRAWPRPRATSRFGASPPNFSGLQQIHHARRNADHCTIALNPPHNASAFLSADVISRPAHRRPWRLGVHQCGAPMSSRTSRDAYRPQCRGLRRSTTGPGRVRYHRLSVFHAAATLTTPRSKSHSRARYLRTSRRMRRKQKRMTCKSLSPCGQEVLVDTYTPLRFQRLREAAQRIAHYS